MLCLQETPDCLSICEMVSGKAKQGKPVFYSPCIHEKSMNKVDDLHSLFKNHMEELKSKLRVTGPDLTGAIDILQTGKEPDHDTSAQQTKAFWALRKMKHSLLTSEMDIRGTKQSFKLNAIPDKKSEWPGTFCILGPSGSGKTHWLAEMIKQHWTRTTPANRRKVIWLSSEVYIDKTLHILTDLKRFEEWWYPVDISIQAGRDSGLTPEDFWLQMVEPKIEHARDSIICWDDPQDSWCPNQCRVAIDRALRCGRHSNNCTVAIFHSIRNGLWTRQCLQSCKHTVLFCRAQKGRVRDFFRDFLGLTMGESRDLVTLLQDCGRATCIRLHNPVCIIAEKYLKLL